MSMLDENGYPNEADLEKIKNWDVLASGVDGLLNLIEENTNWADRQIEQSGKNVIRYVYHTGGWSGNEDVIGALMSNGLFWFMFWQKWQRLDLLRKFFIRVKLRTNLTLYLWFRIRETMFILWLMRTMNR